MPEKGHSMKKRKHPKAEIAAKLAQADDLATQGKLQSEIARTLGVSVMTLHRWRKMSLAPRAVSPGPSEPAAVGDRSAPRKDENRRGGIAGRALDED
jgi:putative transposase